MTNMVTPQEKDSGSAASIGTVERETGLSKDTLRVWERRYGFPQPGRDANGERTYPAIQVEKLRLISRLMERGLRPGKIVGASTAELAARLAVSSAVPDTTAEQQGLLNLLTSHAAGPLHSRLTQMLMERGLGRFLLDIVAPMNRIVGEAWRAGTIQIFEEHLYTQQIQAVVRAAIAPLTSVSGTPRVLLTTLPGEQHELGLLMAHAFLALHGAQCVSLGVAMPEDEIARAAGAHRAHVVALSCSAALPAALAAASVLDLRGRLDPMIELWVGGSVWSDWRRPLPGIAVVGMLADIPAELARWRERNQSAAVQ